MSTITSTNTTNQSSATSSDNNAAKAKDKLAVTTDQFLTILIAQLKHQNPLDPMKGTEFIDSITRLSTVEQAVNQNKNLEQIISLLKGENSQIGNPISYIDKNIEFQSAQFSLKDHLGSFSYNLSEEDTPKNIYITIKDANGAVVALTQGTNKAGVNNVKWDGTNSDGTQLKDGTYTVDVQYEDPKKAGNYIETSTYTTGKVTEADFSGTEPKLKIGDIEIPLTAVKSIKSGTSI